MVMGVLCFLHPLNGLLRFCGITQHIQQIDDFYILIVGVFQDALHPAVGLAAHIDEQVAVGNLDDVIRRGLVSVKSNHVSKAAISRRRSLCVDSMLYTGHSLIITGNLQSVAAFDGYALHSADSFR